MKPNKRLYIILGSDCDPDRPQYGGGNYDAWDGLKWDGLGVGVPRARQIADQVSHDLGLPIRITWCVRSDDQMARIAGDPAWAYRSFAPLWTDLRAAGDEIAWHAHLWRWDENAGCWFQEIEDLAWATDCLTNGYGALKDLVGETLTTSRMGWEFHSDHTMQTIDALGIKQDFTAIAGWYTPGEASRGSRFHCHSDWRGTPGVPYRPSRADYRVAAGSADDSLSLLEIPLSTFSSGVWGGLRTVRKSLRRRGAAGLASVFSPHTWACAPTKAYVTIQPTVFSRLVAERLRAVERSSDGTAILATAFHPDEFLEDDSRSLYSSQHFAANLRRLVEHAQLRRIEAVFMTVAELAEALGSAERELSAVEEDC